MKDLPKLVANQHVAHYQTIKLLGEGGMGQVYLAEDTQLRRRVALKFLPDDFSKDEERARRFAQEARAASALNHPNILTIYEIGKADGRRFMATEFVDGQTLRQRIAGGALKTGEALHIAEQIASALVAAHAAGIIHRDIKPENIMLRPDGLVKVLDFGLAKLTQPEATGPEDVTRALVGTSAGVVLGTAAYMSPEQARGQIVDARSDIWSMGVVIYEMIAGQSPFAGPTNTDLLVSILEREPKPLTSLSVKVPEALDWIVAKALIKDREDRYQTAREMLTDIRRLKQHLERATEVGRSLAVGSAKSSSRDSVTQASASILPPRSSKHRSRLLRMLPFAVAIALIAGILMWKSSALWFNRSSPAGLPVIVLMDSPLPDRVYDPETRKKGGTNADDISDALRDLPVVIQKENTSALWHREDQVVRQNPSLIVVHRSCFFGAGAGFDPESEAAQLGESRLGGFLGYASLGSPRTKFLVYTRRTEGQQAWAEQLEKRFPQLHDRVFTMTVPGGSEHATFRDATTVQMLRQQVQSILGLQ